jgi:hypothetical protein
MKTVSENDAARAAAADARRRQAGVAESFDWGEALSKFWSTLDQVYVEPGEWFGKGDW